MTAQQLAALVGRTGTAKIGAFEIAVAVQDVKEAYGRMLYLVSPVSGTGTAWISGLTLDNAA